MSVEVNIYIRHDDRDQSSYPPVLQELRLAHSQQPQPTAAVQPLLQ